MAIHVLPPSVADKIAAGEVVERPASVVKELVENALDAGATDIKVEVREGGRRLIRVLDNGHGIPRDEVELAFQRHATSKLQTEADLEHIQTMGFRGEALPSIAAVSQVTLVTRARDEDVGTLIRLHGGQIVERQAHGAAGGTIITVENLFYNTPARRKFLRSPRTENAHIQTYLTRVAMAFPERRFTLIADGRTAFQSTGSGELLSVLIEVYGLAVARQLIPLPEPAESDPTSISVTGFVSPPSLHRSNRTQMDLFVNKRWIQDRSLSFAISEAYRTLLPKGRHPIAIVQISMPPAEVDVNVHPAKTEVRFRDGHRVFAVVQKAVRSAVLEQAPVPQITSPTHHTGFSDWERVTPPTHSQMGMAMQHPLAPPADPETTPESSTLPPLRVVGQIAQAYIIAEGPAGMYLIDQHAAHERILYEQLMAARASSIASQTLLAPQAVELTGPQLETLESYQPLLQQLGFQIEPFGNDTVLIRAIPEVLSQRDPGQALLGILDDLAQGRSSVEEEREARIIASVCKQGAVRAGQTLTLSEMQALIRDLEKSQSPRTCPHGRPTMIHLSASQLEREFGRR